jgi:hypothetical protein
VGTPVDVLLVSPLGLPLRERMATEKLEMHVLREILRQKLALGRSHRQVAASVSVSAGKVAGVFTEPSCTPPDTAAPAGA